MEDNEVLISIKKIEALSQMIIAVKDVYFPDRATKDEIIKKATNIIVKEVDKISK